MAIYNPLSWQNEHSLTGYPLQQSIDVPGVIVDAKFVQYDGFVPTLVNLAVNSGLAGDTVFLDILFDNGLQTNIALLKSEYLKGAAYRCVHIYSKAVDDSGRYLGSVTFGAGVEALWDSYMGRVFNYNLQFVPETVRSIPSKDAVYLFDGSYGDVTLTRSSSDTSIFYNTSQSLNSITFNAVEGHSVDNRQPIGLKKINLVSPLNNNIYLASNETIKFSSADTNITIDLASGTAAQAFTVPTLSS